MLFPAFIHSALPGASDPDWSKYFLSIGRGAPLRILAERKLHILIMVVALGTLYPVTTWAQGAPAARDFMNTPVHAATYFGDFLYNKSQTAASANLPVPNNLTVSRVRVGTVLYSFPLFNRYAGIAMGGGYTGVSGMTPNGEISGSGFTDPSFTFHMNFFGAPALRRGDEFAAGTPQSFSSIHFTTNAPLGSYDRTSPVNTGANRWAFNPLYNVSLTPDKGVSYIDLYAGARFFTVNNSFQGSNRLSQDPLGIFAAHYSHNIGKKMYASVGVYYDIGGETSVNRVQQGNGSNGFRPGVSISRLIWKFRVTLRYERTASTPTAAPKNGVIAIRLSGFIF